MIGLIFRASFANYFDGVDNFHINILFFASFFTNWYTFD